MTSLIIERPKTVDLVELFEIKLLIAPGYNAFEKIAAKEIIIGQPRVEFEAIRMSTVNGVLLKYPKETHWMTFLSGEYILFAKDVLVVSIIWSGWEI